MSCQQPILSHSCSWRENEGWLSVRVNPILLFNSLSYTIVVNFIYLRVYVVPNPIEFIYVPYISDSILDFIKKIESPAVDYINNVTLVVAKIKKQIEDKLDEDPILRQLRKFNIVDEIEQLKKSILPSKEITELQTTTSTLKSDTSQLTKLSNQSDLKISQLTKLVEDSKYCSVQSSLKISHLLQEKEKHDSEMLSMKSCIQQLQEDMKMLFRKTSELHYENTLLKKMLEDEKIKTKLSESTGLSFTQANTIGQALMKEDIFNCM